MSKTTRHLADALDPHHLARKQIHHARKKRSTPTNRKDQHPQLQLELKPRATRT